MKPEPDVLDRPVDLNLGKATTPTTPTKTAKAKGGQEAPQRVDPVLDVVKYSTAQQNASDDFKRERSNLAQRWKKNDAPPQPTTLLSEQDFVRKHMPKVAGQQYLPKGQVKYIHEQYKNYVARNQFNDRYNLARYQATPSPLREAQRGALDALLEEFDGDPVKALDAFEKIGVATRDKSQKELLNHKLYLEAMKRYPNDPQKAMAYAQGNDPEAAPADESVGKFSNRAEKAAWDELEANKDMSAVEKFSKLGEARRGDKKTDPVTTLKNDAANEAAQGIIDGPKTKALKRYMQSNSAATPADKGLVSDKFLSSRLAGDEMLMGLIEQAQPGAKDRLGAFGKLSDFVTSMTGGATSKAQFAKLREVVESVRPTMPELRQMYSDGTFGDPAFQESLGVKPAGSKWLGLGDNSDAKGKASRAALKAFIDKYYDKAARKQLGNTNGQ